MNKDYISTMIIIVLLLFLSWQSIRESKEKTFLKELYSKDTIVVRDTIHVEAKGKITYRYKYISVAKDTSNEIVIVSQADSLSFVACVDTMIQKTSLNACYFYPENKFVVDIKSLPDTITKYTIIEKPFVAQKKEKDPWYLDVIKFGSSVVVGFLLGKIK